MKMIYIIGILVSCSFSCLSQQELSKDSIDYFLNKVDDHSIIIVSTYFQDIAIDEDATRLCENSSVYIVKKLIENLNAGRKVLFSHVLLSKVLEINKPRLEYQYSYQDNQI